MILPILSDENSAAASLTAATAEDMRYVVLPRCTCRRRGELERTGGKNRPVLIPKALCTDFQDDLHRRAEVLGDNFVFKSYSP